MKTPHLVLFLFLTICPFLFCRHNIVAAGVKGQCLSHQRSLLLQLKHDLIFNATRSKILVKWNQSSNEDCCKWPGIRCDGEGHVIGLKLSNESISGGVDNNSTLFNLARLQSLDLSFNWDFSFNRDLMSTIPSRIGNLTNLYHLNFSCSGFAGQIPKEISRLSRLVTLDLSVNFDYNVTDGTVNSLEIPNLRKVVQNLTELEELYLDDVDISASGNEWGMAFSSSSLPNLRVLSLMDCNLHGPIPKSLARLNKSLSVIQLDENYDLSSRVPEYFANFSNLTSLSMSGCNLQGRFPKEIFQVQTLSSLDLSYNPLLQVSLPEFPMESRLQSVVLSGINLGGRGLPASIGNLGQLSTLYVSFCSLSGPFPESIANLPQLVHLDLSSNKFEGSLPDSMTKLTQLVHLDLSSNKFEGSLPDSMTKLTQLVHLDLSSNNFEGSLPDSMTKLTKLVHLDLSYNNFKGSLPDSMTKLTQLVNIDLSSNNFEGSLPDSMTKLTQLVHLDLSSNNLSGPILSLHMSKNLTTIRLFDNHFTGPIPTAAHWEGLLNLAEVDLHNNSLNGNIPSSLFSLPSIESIDLSNNQFCGQIPEFPNAPSSLLSGISLYSNQLQGSIPMSIFKFSNLHSLSLSFNRFNGTIQLDMILQNLINLYFLDLSFNNLFVNATSVVGFNFSSIPSLGLLKLASCKLGIFPPIVKNLSALYYLDLSHNKIYGEIPNWIWIGSFLHLNLSHNHLVGKLQESNIFSSVQTLDLSFNKLHGKIPFPFPNAYYLDFSSNGFTSIPTDIGKKNGSDVRYLSLSNNELRGFIPDSICNGSLLIVVDLSNNSLSGRMPMCLLGLSHIFGLNLGRNNLSSLIPNSFPVNCSLHILDLSGNLLTGGVPRSLANCKALEVLNLGNNKMLDSFPKFLKKMSILRVLILQSNKFYGQITCEESIGAWPKIEILDVGSNNFSGELPGKCMTKWHAMMIAKDDAHLHLNYNESYYYEVGMEVINKGIVMVYLKIPKGFSSIDFSSNNFYGEIPNELGQLNLVMVLNLSNNALTGLIPSSFGNLKQLESLDLSRNHLNGEIPTSLSNLDFLQVLNLSHNQLSGRIPEGNHFQTFAAESFEGNEGLCGPPLTPHCSDEPEPHQSLHDSNSSSGIKWDLISVEAGFIVGLGTVIAPLVFSRRWRKRYYDRVEDTAFEVLPQPLLRKWLSWKMGNKKQRKYNS